MTDHMDPAPLLMPDECRWPEPDTAATWACCKCKQPCDIVEDREWPTFKNSACCGKAAYRTDMNEPVRYAPRSPALRMALASQAAAANGDTACAIALLCGALDARREEREAMP